MNNQNENGLHYKIRNNIFRKIAKRSSKVEPHPINDTKIDVIPRDSINKSPSLFISHRKVKEFCDKNSSPNHSDNTQFFNFRTKTRSNNLSRKFGLCCLAKDSINTPPISVRYNSLTEKETHSSKINDIILNESINSLCNKSIPNGASISFDSNSHGSPSESSIKSSQSEPQPKSIAMTACRSRLRLKLLPPERIKSEFDIIRSKINAEQFFSSPNIPLNVENVHLENTRSLSHDEVQEIRRTVDPGTDSLARQALVAAEFLNLIPTENARQRNFLAGKLAVTSLLGATELKRVLPEKEIKIFIGTWNMNGQSPPKQMNDFVLPSAIKYVPDLVVIGTQESCSERFEWEVILQETLGPTHILFHSASLGTLHLAVFLRRDLIWFCSLPEDASMSVRPGTAFRTKGAVAISFCLFGTSMLFVTSHLTAHQQKIKERVHDIKRIINALDLPKNLSVRHKNKDVTQNFDSVYWCGDLNFRLGEQRENLLNWIENTKFPLPANLPNGYMHTDQLTSVLSDGAAFKGFMEANITFPPTYKYDPGTQHFDTSSKQRAPAYTDRILYKYRNVLGILRRGSIISNSNVAQSLPIECLAYDSVPSIISSDHKPVWGLFRNKIRPGIDSIPLAAGLFNREVYLEGMRRRLNSTTSGSSVVCSIQ